MSAVPASSPASSPSNSDDAAPRPRVCFVTTRPAWPLYPGYRLRTANLLRSLATVADVEAVFVLPSDEVAEPLPPDLAGLPCQVVPVPRLSVPKALMRWATGQRPMPMVKVDWASATAKVHLAIDPSRCDAVFVTPSTAWDTVRDAQVPVVTDLDDLDDYKILHRLGDRANYPKGWRGQAQRLMDRLEVRRWKKLYVEMKLRARCLVVCSDIDRERLQVQHVRALPNVYPLPTAAADTQTRLAQSPSILFVGDLTYRPNLEAFTFLEQLMPLVWRTRPDIEVHVVGKNEFNNRNGDPRIHIDGAVADLLPVLARATMVVAPLRSGGGTRIKILEAFAHRIPVVATSVGCEGLAVTQGDQLLIADTPEAFADAIVRLAGDTKLAGSLTANGFSLFERSYTFDALVALMHEVMAFSVGPGHRTGDVGGSGAPELLGNVPPTTR